MELGEKLRQARLEAGMSQRQLCGTEITRNMLSQIENGSAQPSVATLRYLAGQLGKPVGFFLEDEAVLSSNSAVMQSLRQAYDSGAWEEAEEILQNYRQPDAVYDREMCLIRENVTLHLAQKAIREGRGEYARVLLGQKFVSCYLTDALNRERLLLLGTIPGSDPEKIIRELPDMDEELMLRAEGALQAGNGAQAGALLDGAQNRGAARWQLLRGRAYTGIGSYEKAAACFRAVEETYPAQAAAGLEQCYRELRDFEKAYRYACKLRDL